VRRSHLPRLLILLWTRSSFLISPQSFRFTCCQYRSLCCRVLSPICFRPLGVHLCMCVAGVSLCAPVSVSFFWCARLRSGAFPASGAQALVVLSAVLLLLPLLSLVPVVGLVAGMPVFGRCVSCCLFSFASRSLFRF
jgi:hypothetical protein